MKRLFLTIAMLCTALATPCFAQSAAAVVFVSGAAVIVGKDGQSRTAMRGGEIVSGETIDTLDGRVQLRFLDGASMSLQPATRFRIENFSFVAQDGKAGKEDRGFFSLLKGGFRTITGLIGKERREQYRVDAVVATIGIRGTDYAAQLGESGLTLSTFGGLVEVCSSAGCEEVGPGATVRVADRNSRPVLQVPAESAVSAGQAVPGGPPPPVVTHEIGVPHQLPQQLPRQLPPQLPQQQRQTPTVGPNY